MRVTLRVGVGVGVEIRIVVLPFAHNCCSLSWTRFLFPDNVSAVHSFLVAVVHFSAPQRWPQFERL